MHVGSREDIGMKTQFTRPNGLRENAELRFRVGNLDLPERWYTSSREEEEDAQMCPCGKAVELELTKWENMKYTRRNGMHQRSR